MDLPVGFLVCLHCNLRIQLGNPQLLCNQKNMKLLHAENGGVVLYVNVWKRVCSTCHPITAKPGIMHWGGGIW